MYISLTYVCLRMSKKQIVEREIELCRAQLQSLQCPVTLRSKGVDGAKFIGVKIDYTKVEPSSDNEAPHYSIQIHGHDIKVICSSDCVVSDTKLEKIFSMSAFVEWCSRFEEAFFKRYVFHTIEIQSIDLFGSRVGFLKFQPKIFECDPGTIDSRTGRPKETAVSSITFMRGGSVAMLPVFHCADKTYCCLTIQHRIPTGQYAFKEIPAGMMDDDNNFGGVAAKELKEELGLMVHESELVDMLNVVGLEPEKLPGIFLSPGGCDEYMKFLFYRTHMDEEEIESFRGKLTGAIEEGESITLEIVELKDVAKKCADAKSLVALYLYSLLPDSIKLPPTQEKIQLTPDQLHSVRAIAHADRRGYTGVKAAAELNVNDIPNFKERIATRRFTVDGLTAAELTFIRTWAIKKLEAKKS